MWRVGSDVHACPTNQPHQPNNPKTQTPKTTGLKIRRAFGDQEAAALIQEEVAVVFGPEQDEGLKMARAAAEAARAERATTRGRLLEALEIKRLLGRNTEETQSILKALNGEYVLPGVGGDLLRDGTGVLPTGRNIHALDPYRLPSPAAWQRGQEAARKILEQHRAANNGAYPETVAVMLWGLDAIKTRGESVAILLSLVGARPVKEATGRIVKYELIPLVELGRPRVDVLASLSGIFRDSFANVVRISVSFGLGWVGLGVRVCGGGALRITPNPQLTPPAPNLNNQQHQNRWTSSTTCSSARPPRRTRTPR